MLGLIYFDGEGVKKDYVVAYMWNTLAAAQGVDVARKLRDALAKAMTPTQIAEAQHRAQEWKPKTRP